MKLKESVLFFCSIIIIAFSFVVPKLLFQVEDSSRENEIFAIPKKESKIDVQAEKIYLVRFIHDVYQIKNEKVYYSDKKKVAVTVPITERIESKSHKENTKNEVSKLATSGIIKEINFEEYTDCIETANMFWSEYTVVTSNFSKENSDSIGISIEEKTGKIIGIDFFPSSIFRSDIDRKQQLENYVKYLDLDIIDDWVYEDRVLKSEKAQLIIMLEEENAVCMLAIVPTEIYAEYEALKYETEIDESTNQKKK